MWLSKLQKNNLSLTLFLGLLALPSGGFAQQTPDPECGVDKVSILTETGIRRFDVEIADDATKRARGLMFRRDLPQGQGMLFVYEAPQPVAFWMRNTLISLDMLFIDDTGVIRHIHPDARPLDETAIPGAAPGDPDPARLMVLEIAGAEAARLGIEPGQFLASLRLDPSKAVWPCR